MRLVWGTLSKAASQDNERLQLHFGLSPVSPHSFHSVDFTAPAHRPTQQGK